MAETEPTTNDMVNLLRLLGNETEWTYQPKYDEADAIQSFVQARTLPQRHLTTNEVCSSPFVAMMEQQRHGIYCVSPSLEETDGDIVPTESELEFKSTSDRDLLPLDVAELMTSDIIDYDRFSNSAPEVPILNRNTVEDRIEIGARCGMQDSESLSLGRNKRIKRNDDIVVERTESPKSKRSKKFHKRSQYNKACDNTPGPLRALSAYNFFFRDERDRILNNKEHDWSKEKEDALLQGHWNRDRSEKRIHCKTHGKLSFTALSKEVSRRWKALPNKQKDFYRRVAQRDWKRYEKELSAMSQGGTQAMEPKA
ncbi:hypothetical protein FisN_9Hh353 [Fistulifera solaris]|jgi:hypothetical protein|uniref:HMG box domain-containing protein n=1 Tax=Fistulifera solaris TaxID=1519565 RepID=A0A1Z5KDC2_FISSO|nr:hypothetical protein FisN_9Hh353 [Fistulifera solaris]|eukprot:GAX24101.1 hypothetical protein FisN_9Hh353 [Fistulifera solaris]